jgi:hypothetical protein
MLNQQDNDFNERARNMKFLFILPATVGSSSVPGCSLRTYATLFSILMVLVQAVSLIMFLSVSQLDDPISISVLILKVLSVIIWLLALIGPISNNFKTCYVMTIFTQTLAYVDVFANIIELMLVFVVFINYYFDLSLIYYTELMIYSLWFYYIFYFLTLYFYFSYTKSLGQGAHPVNTVTRSYMPPVVIQPAYVYTNSQSTQSIPMFDNMNTIALTNQNDIVFAQGHQDAIVNDTVLPSGIRVPSGVEGKMWRIIGNEVILI